MIEIYWKYMILIFVNLSGLLYLPDFQIRFSAPDNSRVIELVEQKMSLIHVAQSILYYELKSTGDLFQFTGSQIYIY